MRNKKTSLIAMALIVVPLLIFWLLNYSKQNFNTLPYYGEKYIPEGGKSTDTVYYTVPDFKLVSQTGDTITQKNLDGFIYIANFFFASCKDVCPKMNAKVATVYENLKEFSEVKFISHTVDPENDSVPVLKAYASKFHADPTIWYFVTGSKEAMYHAGQGYLLPVSIEDKTIDHSQQLLLIDKSKHIRGIYDGLEDIEIRRLKEDVKMLLYEYHQPNK